MIHTHTLQNQELDLSSCIQRHSADMLVTYKEIDGEQIKFGIFLPEQYDANQIYSTIFFIHGGGWSSRQIFSEQEEWSGDHLGYLARYYTEKGYIGVSIDYRLLQDMGQRENYQLMDLYGDCKDALDYVLDHADFYRIDMKNVHLLGESAGGHLAGLLATKYRRADFRWKSCFLINPLTDLVGDEKWGTRVPVGAEHDKSAKELSPLYHIDANTCPIVLMHGLEDVIVNPAHSHAFYDKMREFGRWCEIHYIEGTGHAFLLAEHTKNIAACKIGVSILDCILMEANMEMIQGEK